MYFSFIFKKKLGVGVRALIFNYCDTDFKLTYLLFILKFLAYTIN